MDADITPAMREWCHLLLDPERHRWERDEGMTGVVARGTHSTVGPTRGMVVRMERAGLIAWARTARGAAVAALTKAGMEAAAAR